jgi:hypothetical protein
MNGAWSDSHELTTTCIHQEAVMPLALRPPSPVPTNRVPRNGRRYPVKTGDTWSTLAHGERITPWNLIDYNFPGIHAVFMDNYQLATKYVNWYLKEYIGCERANGANYVFSTGITKGQGNFAKGHIYLPPKPYTPPPEPTCVAIDIPSVDLPLHVMGALSLANVALPRRARCLSEAEIRTARGVYGESLHYHLIYVSDGVGAQERPFTVACPLDGVWIVVLNMGQDAFLNPGVTRQRATLIHELAHAWQSQHHPEPWRYMLNCLQSQAAAAAASVASQPIVNEVLKRGPGVVFPSLGDADAYSYVPGEDFGQFGGEQIAQQIEDAFTDYGTHDEKLKYKVKMISLYAKLQHAGKHDRKNIQSLSLPRFAYEEQKDVVWHGDDGE